MTQVSHGKPCAGNPHARFDEGVSASETPRRNALLHNSQRDGTLDFIKGVAIILMVWGHAATDWTWPVWFKRWLNLFHMPVFLIAAGWCFKSSVADSWHSYLSFVLKKMKRLWFPYVLWAVIFLSLHNLFLDWNLYSDNPELLNALQGRYTSLTARWGGGQFLVAIKNVLLFRYLDRFIGAMWFVKMLFGILTGYALVELLSRRVFPRIPVMIVQGFVALGLVFMARYGCPSFIKKYVYYVGGFRAFTAWFLFYLGVLMKSVNLDVRRCDKRHLFMVFVGCFVVTLALSRFGTLSLAMNDFPFVVFLAVGALSGWFLIGAVYNLSFSHVRIVAPIMCVGQHTLPILIFHFLAFKVVNAVGCFARGDQAYLIAGWPTTYSGFWWSLIYTLAGVAMPMLMHSLFGLVKGKLFSLLFCCDKQNHLKRR